MEAYYQEAGRAGRDGAPADCVLLYAPGDVRTQEFLIEHSEPNQVGRGEWQRPQRGICLRSADEGYAAESGCLAGVYLRYFVETPRATADSTAPM